MVFQQSAQVLRGGLEVLLGLPDQERLGHLEQAAAFSPVKARHLGAFRHWLQRGVDLM